MSLDDDVLVLYRTSEKENTELKEENRKLRNDMNMAATYWSGAISALNVLMGKVARDSNAVRALKPYEEELDRLSSLLALYQRIATALNPPEST